jgi:hypothetical protein
MAMSECDEFEIRKPTNIVEYTPMMMAACT